MKINQPLPKDETGRHWEEEKILYKWEEKSAYEARGEITGIQVATDGEEIKRIGFAYMHTFEEWNGQRWRHSSNPSIQRLVVKVPTSHRTHPPASPLSHS